MRSPFAIIWKLSRQSFLSLFSGAYFCISFSRCSSLDIRLYTYVFSCSLSRSFRRILPILVSSLTFLHVFLDSLYVFYFLFSFGRRSPSLHHIFNQNPLFPYYYHFSLIFSTTISYNYGATLCALRYYYFDFFAS